MTKVSPTNLLNQVESTNSLRDIKPPVEIAGDWRVVLWVLAVIAIGALFMWLWRKSQDRAEKVSEPYIPAHIRAKKRLREALLFIDQPREFCIRVSEAIRLYLEERFSFKAPERTTEEFLVELQRTDLLTPDQKQSLGEFLERCDLVKFAKYEPAEPELRDLYQSALRLVEETEPAPQQAEPSKDSPPGDQAAVGGHKQE